MTKQEDKIKNYLQLLGEHEDLRSTSFDFKTNFNSIPFNQTTHAFEGFSDITDWQDNRGASYYAASLPKLSKSKELHNKINGMGITSYKSSLLKEAENRRNEDSIFISPVVIKFNTGNNNSSPRKSQLLYHRILHNEDGKKF